MQERTVISNLFDFDFVVGCFFQVSVLIKNSIRRKFRGIQDPSIFQPVPYLKSGHL